MLNKLTVSIILPVYNCAEFIKETVNSILDQSFKDFELIIIDDFSTDFTLEQINQFADERIKLYEKKSNTGYTDSLNWGIELAKGKYVARMDADDVCYPTRFEEQVNYLEKHPEVVAIGTAYELYHNSYRYFPASKHQDIKLDLLLGNVFCHPSMMIRRDILIKNNLRYNRDFEPAEDYKLWIDLLNYGHLANLNIVLIKYRLHPNQVSTIRNEIQINISNKIRADYFTQLGLSKNLLNIKSMSLFWLLILFNNLSNNRFSNILIMNKLYISIKKDFKKKLNIHGVKELIFKVNYKLFN
jgi:glycosyltransferase involved in cell wall biosynthesis